MPSLPRVDLVHPPPYGEVPFKHLGLCYVAAGLRAQGFETRYHDLSERHHRAGTDFYDDLVLRLSGRAGDMSDLPVLELLGEVLFPDHGDSELAATIRGQVREAEGELAGARVVGISFNTLTSYFTALLGRRLRRDGVLVLLGGPFSGYRPVAELMLRLGAADALVAGDGDHVAGAVVRSLIDGRLPREVPGAVFLEDGRFRANPGAPPDLDALSWPELEGNVVDQFIPIQASRGCGRSCAYCSETGIWGRRGYRRRTPAEIGKEMEARSHEHGLSEFHFHDDLLNCNRRWMDELVRELAHGRYGWESFFEPYGLDADLLARMRDAGCRLVKYGVQSFSPPLLRRMKRPPDVQGVVDVMVETYKLGISTHYDMLVGHPGETEEDHRRNLELVEELFRLTGERLHFSLNPFYLSGGSEIERHPERFGVRIRHAAPEAHPPALAEALRACPPYPVGYASDVGRETTMRRMDELAAILRRHGKDYLYLGQREAPSVAGQPRRMLPKQGEPGSLGTTREARARGDADLTLTALVLREDSNLKLVPEPGRVRVVADASEDISAYLRSIESLAVGGKVRILGGEATLSPDLAKVLVAARQLVRTCWLETNGLRFSQARYTKTLVRYGLTHAAVLLLGLDEATADELGGVTGSFGLALEGARSLVACGVSTELGVVLSERTLDDLPRLSALAEQHVRGVTTLRVLDARLRGPGAPGRADPARVEERVVTLIREGKRRGQSVVLEDRG